MKKILVVGIGNPILGDDGVGFHVTQKLARLIKDDAIDIEDVCTGGLNLLDIIMGYDKVVIIDAIKTERGKPGDIYRLRPENFSKSVHPTMSMHDLNFPTVLEVGNKLMPEEMPSEILIFAIEVGEIEKFMDGMTAKVKEAVPKVVNLVLEEIEKK